MADPVELYDELHHTISQLPAPERRAILLLFFEQRSQADAGQKLGSSQQAVSRLKRAALKNLGAYLSERDLAGLGGARRETASLQGKTFFKKGGPPRSSNSQKVSTQRVTCFMKPVTLHSILSLLVALAPF